MNSLRRDWREFWYAPRQSGPLGLFRMLYGAVVVFYCLLLFPDREIWFSDKGPITVDVATRYATSIYNPRQPLSLLNHSFPDSVLLLFFIVFLAAAISLTIGFFTRTSSILVWVGLNALHNRNIFITNGSDTIMVCLAWLLVFAPSGASCSIDRLIRIFRGLEGDEAPKVTPWAWRLMQLQVSTLYLSSVLIKLSGELWQNGTAAYYPEHYPQIVRFPLPPVGIHQLWLINLETYFALASELALGTLVWIPRFRLYALLGGVLLHAGIEYSMNIPIFSTLMVSSYALFLRQPDLALFIARRRAHLQDMKLQLVFDGECDFCRSVLLAVRFFDIFKLVTYTDYHDKTQFQSIPQVTFDQADNAAVAVNNRGKTFEGFYAFRALAWRLPITWPFIVLFYIPGVPILGVKAYRWIAANRSRMPVAPRFAAKSQPAESVPVEIS